MSKDPAVLFYTSDFLTGCLDLDMEERGQYITLLCLQHQKGHLSDKTIRLSLGKVSEFVLNKFEKDEKGFFYNKRMEDEIKKRLEFTNSRRLNGKKGGRPKKVEKPSDKPLGLPSENLIENENENINKNEYANPLERVKNEFPIKFEDLKRIFENLDFDFYSTQWSLRIEGDPNYDVEKFEPKHLYSLLTKYLRTVSTSDNKKQAPEKPKKKYPTYEDMLKKDWDAR